MDGAQFAKMLSNKHLLELNRMEYKPTATENNTASQAEQPETSVQEPITESPPEAEILRQKIAATGKS